MLPGTELAAEPQRGWNSGLPGTVEMLEGAGLPTATQGVLVMHHIPAEKKPKESRPRPSQVSLGPGPEGSGVPWVVMPNVWANNTIQQDLLISEGE